MNAHASSARVSLEGWYVSALEHIAATCPGRAADVARSALAGPPAARIALAEHLADLSPSFETALLIEAATGIQQRNPQAFNGDNRKLVHCIRALLGLDAAKALVPHGLGGHARTLLATAADRLEVQS